MRNIESAIREKLTGDAQINALNYVAFLEENCIDRLLFEDAWCYADGSVLYIDGGDSVPGPWTIWADCPPSDIAHFPADEHLKEFAWKYANTCGQCGCGAQPGLRKILFGKSFENICTATLMFTDPDSADLESIKKLALMNRWNKEHYRHPIEKAVASFICQGCCVELVERPDVHWVGCVDYARNNRDESDIQATLKRYREELIDVPKLGLINPDWSASISINYKRDDKPCGIMFAQETNTGKQDERYEVFTQPGGLWLRIRNDTTASSRLLGKERAAPYEYFAEAAILKKAAEENGYMQNHDIPVEIEYHCHAEYGNPPHTNYAYIAVVKKV